MNILQLSSKEAAPPMHKLINTEDTDLSEIIVKSKDEHLQISYLKSKVVKNKDKNLQMRSSFSISILKYQYMRQIMFWSKPEIGKEDYKQSNADPGYYQGRIQFSNDEICRRSEAKSNKHSEPIYNCSALITSNYRQIVPAQLTNYLCCTN